MTVISRGPELALCARDVAGGESAIPYAAAGGDILFTCTSGAIGKCIRWGYTPSAGALHEACVRMVRADYGGDGTSFTRDGTPIAFCDRAGIHRCRQPRDIEAAWAASGAVCVGHPRISEIVTLEALAARYPALRGHTGSACEPASPALLVSWRPPHD